MNVGDRIKSRRSALGLTLQELGDMIGVEASTVRKWENGMIKNLKMDKINKLATSLGVSANYIIGVTNNTVNIETISVNSMVDQNSGILNITKDFTKEELELLRIFNNLDVKKRMKLLNFAMELEEDLD